MVNHGGFLWPALCALALVACSADAGGDEAGSRRGDGTPVGTAGTQSTGTAGLGGSATAGTAGSDPFGQQPASPTAGMPAFGSDPSMPFGEGCADANVNTSRVVPTVLFVIDGSGSMRDDFNGVSRWEALRSALMDPDGIVPTLESAVRFGMVLYHGPQEGGTSFLDSLLGTGTQMGVCPDMRIIDPDIMNFALLDQNYPQQQLGGSTPTHTALDFVMNNLADTEQVTLDADLGPQYVVLATDGEPNDGCVSGTGTSTMPQVVAAANVGAAKGVKMFVISLAQASGMFQAHLEELATIGNTGYAPFSPQTKDELQNVLIQVIGGAIGCQVALNGTVTPGNECLGYVEVNGNRLECGSDNGWRLVDERTFELTGTACTDFLTSDDALLHADFPCDVFTPE